jgi:xanthine/uracil permease
MSVLSGLLGSGGASQRFLVYGVEEKPKSLVEAALLGLQHYLIMFGATVAVPIIIATMLAETYRLPEDVYRDLVWTMVTVQLLGAGLATLLQVNPRIGSGLPIVQGSSFSFLGPILAIVGSGEVIARLEGYKSLNHFVEATDPYVRASIVLSYVTGSIMAASLFEILLGYSGLMGRLKKYITPVSIGPTITVIGLSLYSAPAAMNVDVGWWQALLVVLLIVVFNQILGRRILRLQMFSIMLSLVIVWAISAAATLAGLARGATAVDFEPLRRVIEGAELVRPPTPLPWGWPRIFLPFVIGMLAAYLASMVESIGDYHTVSKLSGLKPPSPRTISKGLGAEGLGCFIASLFGAVSGYTSYSENIAAIGLTRVASRFVFVVGGLLIILLGGVLTVWGAFMASMPKPVIGGMYLALFGLIAAVGVSVTALADLTSPRNLLIIGVSMFAGLAVPVAAKAAVWPQPPDPVLWTLVSSVKLLSETGMAVTAAVAIALDNLIPGTPEERGLRKPEWLG